MVLVTAKNEDTNMKTHKKTVGANLYHLCFYFKIIKLNVKILIAADVKHVWRRNPSKSPGIKF